jgi:flagellar motor switch/type III secretory pathway protein FliN
VNKNVIAKGELVEISGNYGLEITQICQSLDKSPL